MGFVMWGWMHILFIISPFALAAVLCVCTWKSSFKTKRLVGIILSAVMIALLVSRNVEIFLNNGKSLEPEIIPLQICHFANFILLFAFIFNNKTLFGLSFCLNLPAALMSIIFANSLTNYSAWNIRGIVYLLGHMLIVGVILWALIVDMIKITRKSFLFTLLTMFGIYIVSLPINNLFNMWFPSHFANYFYSLKPESGTPLEVFWEWGTNFVSESSGWQINPVYLLSTMGLGLIIVSAFYGMYTLGYYIKSKIKKTV